MLAVTNTTYLLAIAAVVGVVVLVMLVKLLLKAAIFAVALVVVYLLFAPGVGMPGVSALYHKIVGQAAHVDKTKVAHQAVHTGVHAVTHSQSLREQIEHAIVSELTVPPGAPAPKP